MMHRGEGVFLIATAYRDEEIIYTQRIAAMPTKE